MVEQISLLFNQSTNLFFSIMISIGFFIGIILMIAPDAYQIINRAMSKEYGLRVRLIPQMEDKSIDLIDRVMMKYRKAAGFMISVTAFILLLLNR